MEQDKEQTIDVSAQDLSEVTGWTVTSHARYAIHFGGAGQPYATKDGVRCGSLTLEQLAAFDDGGLP